MGNLSVIIPFFCGYYTSNLTCFNCLGLYWAIDIPGLNSELHHGPHFVNNHGVAKSVVSQTLQNQTSNTDGPRRNMHRFLSFIRHASRSSSASSLPFRFEVNCSARSFGSLGALRSHGSSESASLYKCFSVFPQSNEHVRGFSSMNSGWNTLDKNFNASRGFNPDSQRSVNLLGENDSETKTSSRPMDFVRRIVETDGKGVMGAAELSGYNLEHDHDVVHIKLLRNNTFVTVTDSKGNVKLKSSVGCLKDMKGGQKLARYAAEATAEEVGRMARRLALKSVVVKVKGFTYFKKKRQAIESWRDGFTNSRAGRSPIVCVEDTTRIPHNGCRRPKKRRI
ncbi:probable ribosomal protein S11, mitochondrial [Prosopis cineraria]|uniref:probable ribosomal protein S11, mitochondrial n=1 Tax=Prosopis cineraria TaxID=364024 RepID=UPI002410B518|nr:probable ribosomal protein S11, mitochondrial [Prosopis cineraria]